MRDTRGGSLSIARSEHAGFVCTQAYPIKAEMSVSMPLKQATSPIHLDLILVCRKERTANGRASNPPAIDRAREQISTLKSAGIEVSLGDAKVILMGCFLCEAHAMGNIEREEAFLWGLEQHLDAYVYQVIPAKSEAC